MPDIPATFGPKVLDWERAFDDQGRQDRTDLPAGSCFWLNNQAEQISCLTFVCPCGCGKTHAINVNVGRKVEQAWEWNGSTDKPTLTPSIQCLTPCRWHGYLTDGVFRQC